MFGTAFFMRSIPHKEVKKRYFCSLKLKLSRAYGKDSQRFYYLTVKDLLIILFFPKMAIDSNNAFIITVLTINLLILIQYL